MGESEKGRGQVDNTELKNSPEIIFGVDADFVKHLVNLEEACSVNNPGAIKKILDGNKFVENIVIRKGERQGGVEWLQLLERAEDVITQAELGKNINEILDPQELARLIVSAKLSPFAIAELAAAYYHLDKDDQCEQLANLITGFEGSEIDATSRGNAFNTLGSLYLRQGAVKGSVEANKAGLSLWANAASSDHNAQWQKSKLKYGVVIGKITSKEFSDAPEQLFALRREREKLGDTFNLGRIDLDAARAFAAQNKKKNAIEFAERAKDLMSSTGYWSGAEQAEQLLGQLKPKK